MCVKPLEPSRWHTEASYLVGGRGATFGTEGGANFGLEGFATALMGGQRLMARLVPWFALRVMGAL